MGTVTRSITKWFQQHGSGIRTDVIDPRGEGGAAGTLVRLPIAVLKLWYLHFRYGSDVLHAQVSERMSFLRKGVLVLVARALGMKTVLHHHGAEVIQFYETAPGYVQRWVKTIVETADVNIVIGNKWALFLIDEMGIDPTRVEILFNAAYDVLVSGERRRTCGNWQFLLVANLSPRKGVSELLRAVAQLASSGHPVALVVAGGGQINRYVQEAEALGIEDRCRFLGWLVGPAVNQLFLEASALVLPSYDEGLPITIIEALSANLPVIATPVGSIPELLTDGENCLLVKPGNVEELARAMHAIASSEDLRGRLSENGRRLYEQRFDMAVYMARIEALYTVLVGR